MCACVGVGSTHTHRQTEAALERDAAFAFVPQHPSGKCQLKYATDIRQREKEEEKGRGKNRGVTQEGGRAGGTAETKSNGRRGQ